MLYSGKDSDYDGDMHETSRARVPVNELDVDPYEEGMHREMQETPENIAQFRKDLRDSRLLERVQKNWRSEANTSRVLQSDLEQQQARLREETVRAMRQARNQQSLFDLDYARSVPEAVRGSFLALPQTERVCAALVPMLITQNAPGTTHQTHVTEEAMKRVLLASGCEELSCGPETVHGHASEHEPRLIGVGVHAHFDAASKTTPLRVLVFAVPPDKYRVRVVCHCAPDNLLCFRAFHFLQPQQ